MATFILHIGLPKTATTTVQYELFGHESNREIYLGKHSDKVSDFHQTVSNFLSGDIPDDEAHEKIERLAAKPGLLIYSNEMLTVNSNQSWRRKLLRLGELMKHSDSQILVTLRKPSKHAASVYAELKPTARWTNFDEFLKDSQSDWLDPMVLNGVLLDAGFGPQQRIHYIDFEELVGSQFNILKTIIPGLFVPKAPPERNARARSGNTIVSRPIGFYDVAYSWAKRSGLLKIAPARARRFLGMLLRKMSPTWRQNVELPSNSEALEKLDQKYAEALQELRNNYET